MRKFRALWVRSTKKWAIDCPMPGCFDVIMTNQDYSLPHDRAMAHLFRRHPDIDWK